MSTPPAWISQRTSAVTLVVIFCVTAVVLPAERPVQQPSPEAKPSEDVSIYDRRGVDLAQSGDLSAAIKQFRSALRLSPNYAQAWYHLGLAYDQARDTDQAMTGFEEALRVQPDYVEARYMLADCCRKRGDFAGERNVLGQVTAQAPQFAEAHYNYGIALKNGDKPQAAVQELRAAVKLSPDNAKYMLALGVALAEVDRKEAVTILRGAVQHGATSADAYYNLGLALGNDGDDTGAEQELTRALETNPKHAAALRALGVTLMHEGKLEQAARALRQALDAAPRDAEASNNLGTVQLKLKDYGGAIESLQRAVELNPNLIKAHANLAQAYQRTGRNIDARNESERVASLTAQLRNRGRAMVQVQAAVEQFRTGRTADALSELRRAIDLNPDFPDAHLELGRVIRGSGGDPNAAIAEFRRVLSVDPEYTAAHYEIGLTLERAGRKPEALPEYQIAVEMTPCDLDARRALGKAALNAGRWALAASQFRAVIALELENTDARRQFDFAVAQQRTAP
jgi:tetratricopeptide (TPR) repeat protein